MTHLRTLACLALAGTLCAPMALSQTASVGCGNTGIESGLHSIDDNGLSRTYRLHLPRDYDADTPTALILAFHGWGGDEDSFLGQRVVRRLANQMGVIVAAPRGLGENENPNRPNSWTFPGSATGLDGDALNTSVPGDTALICNDAILEDETYPSCGPVGTGTAQSICSWTHCQTDDMAFVETLLTELESTLCLDKDRIFAVGASNGGMFVWGLGQHAGLAPKFRAIASLIGLPHRGFLDGPGGAADLPVLVVTGTEDPVVPTGTWEDPSFTTTSDGTAYYYTGATAITRAWATARSCDTTAPAQSVPGVDTRFDCRSYCGAPADATLPPVLDCRFDGGHDLSLRHSWPLVLDFFRDAATR